MGPQQRALLAALTLARGRPISRDRLIELIWEGATPEGAVATLRTHVLHLRRVLEPQRRAQLGYRILVSVGGQRDTSYALQLGDDQVDAQRFLRLTEEARYAAGNDDARTAVRLLDRALALWYGPALEEVRDRGFALAEVNRLEEMRLVAREDRVEALLALGGHDEVMGELATLVAEHPLRERLRAQLMLALYRAGRQADALAAYRDIYRLLDEELGVAPGRPLAELHQRVLGADPGLDLAPERQRTELAPAAAPPRPVPRQLPPDVRSFTGRETYLRELDSLLPAGEPTAGQTLVISSLHGMAGAGKTALAVRWAHSASARFPDGQLFLPLNGYGPGRALTPDEALGQALRGLGVAPAHLPEGPDEKAGLYRSLLADKRVLVVLDDAAGLDQVRPLLPGSPYCFVVVTSRNDLRGLTAFHDAHRVGLEVLSDDESTALLARAAGADRVRDEPEAAAALVRLCRNLPLALRIVAAHLVGDRYRRIVDVVRALEDGGRLSGLTVEGEQQISVRAAFEQSYRTLPEAERALFRRLGLAPMAELPAQAVAALAGTEQEETARSLERLVSRSMLDVPVPGRYRCHELLWRYAAELAEQEDEAAERDSARRRLLSWYLTAADRAAHTLHGTFYSWYTGTASEPTEPGVRGRDFAGAADADGWLTTEYLNLLACTEQAAVHGPQEYAWKLMLALHGHLTAYGQRSDWLCAAREVLRAVEATEDHYGQAVMNWSLGYVLWELGRHDESVAHSRRAEERYGQLGAEAERGGALLGLAAAHRERAEHEPAEAYARQALDLYEQWDEDAGLAWAAHLLGLVHLDRGALPAARAHFERARQAGERSGDAHSALLPRYGLGTVDRLLGRTQDALTLLSPVAAAQDPLLSSYAGETALCALALACRDTGDPRLALKHAADALNSTQRAHRRLSEPEALNTAGAVLLSLGDLQDAEQHYRRALDLAVDAACRRAESVARTGLAAVHRRSGQPRVALGHARGALETARRAGLRLAEGDALVEQARVHAQAGRRRRAREAAEAAVRVFSETGCVAGLREAAPLLDT
nr:BTAD domain-containing putative transcriptional regulator [Streptomyces boncukensis]